MSIFQIQLTYIQISTNKPDGQIPKQFLNLFAVARIGASYESMPARNELKQTHQKKRPSRLVDL